MCVSFHLWRIFMQKYLWKYILTIISISFRKNDIKSIMLGIRITENFDFNNHLTSVLDPILTFFSNEFL